MGKRGRPRKEGSRNKSGRLVFAVERGNDKVQERTERFRKCQGGKAGGQIGDSIGRVWAVGLLDGTEYDPAILRDTGRRYGQLYWGVFAAMAPKMGATERKDRTSGGPDGVLVKDPGGEAFSRLDRAGHRRGRDAYAAMQSICVNDWWFPDLDQPWVERLINAALRRQSADTDDLARLALAKQGLCALVDGPPRPATEIALHRLTTVDHACDVLIFEQ